MMHCMKEMAELRTGRDSSTNNPQKTKPNQRKKNLKISIKSLEKHVDFLFPLHVLLLLITLLYSQ